MKLERRDEGWLIAELSIEQMAFLWLGVPADEEIGQVLTALLKGERVAILAEGLEYKRYKKTAPLGAYQKFMGMERELREMGVYVIRQGH